MIDLYHLIQKTTLLQVNKPKQIFNNIVRYTNKTLVYSFEQTQKTLVFINCHLSELHGLKKAHIHLHYTTQQCNV